MATTMIRRLSCIKHLESLVRLVVRYLPYRRGAKHDLQLVPFGSNPAPDLEAMSMDYCGSNGLYETPTRADPYTFPRVVDLMKRNVNAQMKDIL